MKSVHRTRKKNVNRFHELILLDEGFDTDGNSKCPSKKVVLSEREVCDSPHLAKTGGSHGLDPFHSVGS